MKRTIEDLPSGKKEQGQRWRKDDGTEWSEAKGGGGETRVE